MNRISTCCLLAFIVSWITPIKLDAQQPVFLGDLNPGIENSQYGLPYTQFIEMDGQWLFWAHTEEHGRELWKTDGTPEGTALFLDIFPGPESGFNHWLSGYETGREWYTLRMDGRVYFSAQTPEHGWELWSTDGTLEGTIMVKDIIPGETSGMDYKETALVYKDHLYFQSQNTLWKTDGTAEGTVQVLDHNGIPVDRPDFLDPVVFKEFLVLEGQSHQNLYRTNGTNEGTAKITFFDNSLTWINIQANIDDTHLIFMVRNDLGREFWVSDGTPGSETLLKELMPGEDDGVSNRQGIFFDGQYFFAGTSPEGTHLWKTDGTADGTVPITTSSGTRLGPSGWIHDCLVFNNALYFGGITDGFASLWKVPGANAFAEKVYNPTIEADQIEVPWNNLCDMGDYFLFGGSQTGQGREESLFRTDGTEEGTYAVHHFDEDTLWGYMDWYAPMVRLGNKAYFFARTEATGTELWSTDGTTAGTQLTEDINPGIYTSQPFDYHDIRLIPSANRLFFSAASPDYGREVYTIEGWSLATSTDERIPEKEGLAYPNPTSGLLHLPNDWATNRITVYNTMGQCVGTWTGTVSSIHLNHLPAGAYVVRSEGQLRVVTQRILKH